MRVAGFQKLDANTKREYIDLFNSNAIFLMDAEDRPAELVKDAGIVNELTETATLILYRGEFVDEKFYLICERREKELLNRLFIKGYVKQEINDSLESLDGLYGIYFNYLKGKLNNKAMSSFLGKPESSFAQMQKRMDGLIRKGLL